MCLRPHLDACRTRQTDKEQHRRTDSQSGGEPPLRRKDDEDAVGDAVMVTPIVHTSGKVSYVRTAPGARNSPIWLREETARAKETMVARRQDGRRRSRRASPLSRQRRHQEEGSGVIQMNYPGFLVRAGTQ